MAESIKELAAELAAAGIAGVPSERNVAQAEWLQPPQEQANVWNVVAPRAALGPAPVLFGSRGL